MNASSPIVGELMTRHPVTIREDAPLANAERLMAEHRVSGLPVVNKEGRLVGVVSQTDMIRAHITDRLWSRWPGLAVRHLMSSPALTVPAETPIVVAARRMEEHHVHRLVVIDVEHHPVGVFSTTDLARAVAQGAEA